VSSQFSGICTRGTFAGDSYICASTLHVRIELARQDASAYAEKKRPFPVRIVMVISGMAATSCIKVARRK
jgi:hypothetical protein